MMSILRHNLTTISIALFSALSINIALAGPVEDGGTLTCSDDTSKANINDIRFPGTGLSGGEKTYLEVFILEPNVDISDWQLCYTYGNKNDCTELGAGDLNEYFYGNPQGDDASPDSFNTGTYLELEIPNNQTLNPTEGEVLLVNNIDGTDVVIDYIQYCDSATCETPRWDVEAACGFTLTNHDAGNKDIARLPDGDGDFGDNGDEVTRGDTNDDSAPTSAFGFNMDEAVWNGSNGEVIDPTGFTSGTAVNGAITSATNPAVTGTPGTCGYGSFDGVDDYISIAPLNPPDGEDEVEINNSITLTAWVQTNNNTATQTIFSFQDDSDFVRLSVTNTGKLTYSSNLLTPGSLSSADGALADDTWYFVSLVIDLANSTINLYTAEQAGALNLVATNSLAIAGGEDEFELEIEDAGDLTIGGGSGLNSFSGFIDEFNLFGGPLDADTLANVKAITRPCAVSGPAHYAISHAGTGITCAPTAITFSGHTAGDTLIAPTAGTTITVSINNNTVNKLGTWSLNTGNGTFAALADGVATYIFDGTETEVILDLLYPQAATINLNVTDGSLSESEDPDLTIGRAILKWSTINTQISGKPSDTGLGAQAITLQALRESDNNSAVCVPGFPDNTNVNIELGAECLNPSTCAGNQISITNNAITTAISTNDDDGVANGTSNYTTVPLFFTANATANIIINYPDAGQMQLHSLFNTSNPNFATGTAGSSNTFVVRPFAFRMSVAGNFAETTVTEGSNIFRDAGENFDVILEAVTWQQTDDTNDDGIPDNFNHSSPTAFSDLLLAGNNVTPNFGNETISTVVDLSPTIVAPLPGTNGNLSLTTASFSNGTSSTTTSWDEVGAMTINAQTTDYLSGGQNITGTSATIGRFHPAQYEVSVPSVTEACGAFTYSRQAFNDTIIIKAQNTSGSTTMNYRDGFATLTDLSDTAELPFRNDQTPGPDPYDSQNGTYVIDFSTGNLGEAMLDMQLTWNMPEQVETTTTVQMTSPSTDDGGINIVPGGMPDLTNLGMSVTRFGRLNITNAFGSELVNLSLPLTTEYFTANGYILNTDDNCTVLTDAPAGPPTWGDITLVSSSYTGNLTEGETTPSLTNIVNGSGAITLTAPGAGNDGSVVLNITAPLWLLSDWDGVDQLADGDLFDDDPSAIATFGIFNGNDSTIYLRELY